MRSRRRRFEFLPCSKCRRPAPRCVTLPVPVILNRFDTDFLVSNAYRARYILENQSYFDQLVVDGFYNRTSLHGDAQHQGKRILGGSSYVIAIV